MVRTEVPVPLPGVTEPGANEQPSPCGKSEHCSAIGLLNEPLLAATVTFKELLPPETTVNDDGFAVIVKAALPDPPPVPTQFSVTFTAGEI